MLGLYIHIPFCIQKCYYCSFNSYSGISSNEIDAYILALEKEISYYAKKEYFQAQEFTSVYCGGGTPTFLTQKQLEHLLRVVKENLKISKDAEITIEANPGTVDAQKLKALLEYGVNRLSYGLQSTEEGILQKIGRVHSFDDFLDSYSLARNVGFTNINADLIYGLPDLTAKGWKETLEKVIGLQPEHISLYGLSIDEGTEFHRLKEAGKLQVANEDVKADMYEIAIDYLSANGYKQYEISNFSRLGYESRHNITYWMNFPYLGVGAGACSYLDGKRITNIAKPEEYIERFDNPDNENWIDFFEELSEQETMGETVMLGLRLTDGVDSTYFYNRFGVKLQDVFGREIARLVANGLLIHNERGIRLTRRGMMLGNCVFQEFI